MYALVRNDTIVNVVACDAAFASANGLTEINQTPQAAIGWTLANGVWTAPAAPPTVDPKEGVVQLENGVSVVSNNQVTTASVITPSAQATTIVGNLRATITADGAFTITSTVSTDHGDAGFVIR